jgi:hypothetical protein
LPHLADGVAAGRLPHPRRVVSTPGQTIGAATSFLTLPRKVVFNIRGNKYRLAVWIDYDFFSISFSARANFLALRWSLPIYSARGQVHSQDQASARHGS